MLKARSRLRSAALVVLAIIGVVILVDRVVLYTWAMSVLRQFQRYRESASAENMAQGSVSISEITAPPLWHKALREADEPRRNPNFLLALEPAFARPNFVDVRGTVVTLTYLPPALAWSTRILPTRPSTQQFAYYRPQDYYGYQIQADFSPSFGPPSFKLYRSTSTDKRELPLETRLPELFP